MFGSGAVSSGGGRGSGFGIGQASTGGGGFGVAPAAIPGKSQSTFGTTTSSSGFGTGGGTTIGQGTFGTNAGTTAGFGGAGAAGTTGGFGATGTTTGFGATGTTTGFGATGTTTGFGATGTTTGFGATGTTTGFGGAGAAGTTTGFGAAGTTGFGAPSMGFGGAGNKAFGTGLGIGAQTQVPPYKGMKGPGFSTDWARSVNFSTLRDDTIFEDLPPPLQQHLTELHSFIQSEHDAKKYMEKFLSDSVAGITNNSSSYRELQKKLSQLTCGENAVDTVRVDCFEREVQSQQLGQILEKFEEEVSQYTKRVWEPLADQDIMQWRRNNGLEPPSEPFQRSLKDIQSRMHEIAAAIEELEIALVPSSQRQKHTMTTVLDSGGGAVNAATEPSSSALPFAPPTVVGGLEPFDATPSMGVAGPPHPVAQMNTTLHNELTTLLNLAAWTSRLHARADGARDLFAHLYGASESELLLAQQRQQMSNGPKRPFPPSRGALPPRNVTERETLGDIHRRSLGLPRLSNAHGEDRRMQYDVLLERQRQTNVPTESKGILNPASTQTAALKSGGFGAAAAPAAPAAPGAPGIGGFGAAAAPAAPGAPGAPGIAGFGASAAPAAPGAPGIGGFGASAAPAAPGAPGIGGFGAAAAPAATSDGVNSTFGCVGSPVAMVGRMVFAHNHMWRQSKAPRLIVKSLNRFDNSTTVTVPIAPQPPGDAQGAADKENGYITIRRSAYSVLRNRNGAPNTCAQNMIPPVVGPAPTNMDRCCCTALLYRADEGLTPQLTVDEERDRDDFVFALKLAGVEALLHDLVGEEHYAMLVGHTLTKAQQVALCQDLPQLSACTNEDDDAAAEGPWVARLLLTLEEDNRIRWLREDGGHTSAAFARMPSFKAMYVMYHVGLQTSSAQQPTVRDLEAIQGRMREKREEWDMSDVAVIAILALRNDSLGPFLCHVIRHVLLEESVSDSTAFASSSPSLRDAHLRHVLAALLLLQCARRLRGAAQQSGGRVDEPPTYLLTAASQLFRIAAALRQGPTAQIVASLTRSCSETVLSLSALCYVPMDSPRLPDFTLWLLREAAGSASCHSHFSRMVQRSHHEALALLERSGIFLTRAIDLAAVVDVVLPLLDSSRSEEFFFLVIREVLAGLEERLRRDAPSFTSDDMRRIAALGTRLCETPAQGHAHDIALCGQLEELSVMDGSPWALVASSYGSLKEILRALVRDHRRVKRQVRAQVRNIVEAVTAQTIETAPAAGPTVGLTGRHDNRDKLHGAPASTSTANPSSSSASASASASSPPTSVGGGRRMRLSTPPVLRERFIMFVEELVRTLVDETGETTTRSMVVNDALYAFVNHHIPIPNIHDEYRRKLFFLVNVSDGICGRSGSGGGGVGSDDDVSGEGSGKDDIPPELRLLVSSLPLTLSPWASVMILREVLSESAGNNPRYTYVLNAAIDLQLPISTTRSRIATTLNMWRFLSSQAEKLTFTEQVAMKRRCVLNLPFAYILSSYWSLLTWLFLVAIIGLNVVGLDFESQYVATRLFDQFTAPDDVIPAVMDPWSAAGAEDLVSLYLADASPCDAALPRRISSETILSSASSLFLGAAERRYPMTVVCIGCSECGSGGGGKSRNRSCLCAAELTRAAAVLRALSQRVSFPFYVPLEKQLPLDLIIARVAERIRRVSFDHAWFVSRVIFRTFPLGRHQTEYGLVSHTCAQANLTRRRVTFLLHVHHGVPLTPTLLVRLRESVLAHGANLVVVAPQESLALGGTAPQDVANVRWLSHSGDGAAQESQSLGAAAHFGPKLPTRAERMWARAVEEWDNAVRECSTAREKVAMHGAWQRIAEAAVEAANICGLGFGCGGAVGAVGEAADPFGRAAQSLIVRSRRAAL